MSLQSQASQRDENRERGNDRSHEREELRKALTDLTQMIDRYKHTILKREPLVQYFEALDVLARTEERASHDHKSSLRHPLGLS